MAAGRQAAGRSAGESLPHNLVHTPTVTSENVGMDQELPLGVPKRLGRPPLDRQLLLDEIARGIHRRPRLIYVNLRQVAYSLQWSRGTVGAGLRDLARDGKVVVKRRAGPRGIVLILPGASSTGDPAGATDSLWSG